MKTLLNRISLVAILVAAAAGMGQQPREADLVWPKPPDQPRIRHLETFSAKADLSIERPWWKKLISLIFGGEDEDGFLIRPQGIFADGRGRIFVADPGARGVHVFNREENEYDFLRAPVKNGFISPVGVAVAEDGTCYVTDSELPGVVVFDADLEYVATYHDDLMRPTGIAIRKDTLYIVDTGTHQVVVSDLRGNVRARFGHRGTGQGEFNFPVYLASAGAPARSDAADLYVVDAMNFRIQGLRGSGNFVSSFGAQGTGAGSFAGPKGIATDSDGHLYVVDALFDAVQIFDGRGGLLLVFGATGTGDGEFSLPTGICIDKNDRIYVVDTLNRRIQVFQYLKRP